jgi:hypothetical protein
MVQMSRQNADSETWCIKKKNGKIANVQRHNGYFELRYKILPLHKNILQHECQKLNNYSK